MTPVLLRTRKAKNMGFDIKKRNSIFARTDGLCHICRKKLVFKNYGQVGKRGAWEVEHSVPKAAGGTDHGNNLYASCIPCNRKKQASSTRSARAVHGHRAAPLSNKQKQDNAAVGSLIVGAASWILLPPPLRLAGAVIGMIGGHVIGSKYQPK